MNLGKRKIDHIVYGVLDLEDGVKYIHELLGVQPTFGGYHTTEGTKNAILNLGEQVYLELLAIDKNNHKVTADRWMGIDLIEQPKITRWALKSSDLKKDSAILGTYNPELRKRKGGQRKLSNGELLTWELSMPSSTPEVELMPFMIDWKAAVQHPTTSLPDECRLIDISIYHPDITAIQPSYQQLSIDLDVQYGSTPEIKIKVQCPNGIVEI